MRYVIIDIRPLLPKNPPTGVPEYTRELLCALLGLVEKKKNVRLFLFSSGKEKPDLRAFESFREYVSHYHIPLPNKLLNALFKLGMFPGIDTLIKKRYGLSRFANVTMFAPNINLLPLSSRAKLVITFHDLSFERYPFFLKPKEKLWHLMVNPLALARRADTIIAVSQSTKQDLISLYGVPEKNVTVIYSGISKDFKNLPSSQNLSGFASKNLPSSQNLSGFASKNLPFGQNLSGFASKPFPGKKYGNAQKIFYLGSADGRKNLDALIKAFRMVKKRLPGKELELVLAGPPHRVVSFKERVRLYQEASIFVYPSVFEGFGLPPVEAMRCGIAVIASHTSSLPEALGNGALLVNPHKIAEIAKAMELLLTDETLREHYIAKGLAQASRFSWQKAARETLAILLS